MKIKHILFEISGSCNFNCRYCYFHSRKYLKEISTSKAKQIILTLKHKFDIQSIGFTGGEPLMRDDLFKILKYCRSLNIETSVGTNGSLINKSNVAEIKKYVDTLTVSLDGEDPYFSWITDSSAYNAVTQGLKLLNCSDVPFGIHITVTPQNLENLSDLIKKYKRLGARFIQIGDVQCTQTVSKTEGLILGPDQLFNLYKTISDYEIENKNFIKHVFLSKTDLGPKLQWDRIIGKYFKPFFAISPDGNLYPMVDSDDKWILCRDILSGEIDIPKLEEYISKIPDMITIAKQMLRTQEVISPYSIINKYV